MIKNELEVRWNMLLDNVQDAINSDDYKRIDELTEESTSIIRIAIRTDNEDVIRRLYNR